MKMFRIVIISIFIVMATIIVLLFTTPVKKTAGKLIMYEIKTKNSNIDLKLKESVKERLTSTVGIDGTTSSNEDNTSNNTDSYDVADRAKPYWGFVKTHSKEYNIDPVWIAAMITNESTWDPNDTSSADARGLMQIEVPNGTWASVGEGDPYDPEQNIKAGVKLFNNNLDSAKRYGYSDKDSSGATGEQYKNALLIYVSGEGNYIKTEHAGTGEAQNAYKKESRYYTNYISGKEAIGMKDGF